MRAPRLVALLLVAVVAGFQAQTAAAPAPGLADRKCPPKTKRATFSPKDTGEVLEGPACIVVLVNALRYSADLARTVTITAGPNLSAVLTPPREAGGEEPVPSRSAIDQIRDKLTVLRNQALSNEQLNLQAAAAVSRAVGTLKGLVSQSDDIYRSNGPAGVLSAARDPQLAADITAARRARWEAADIIYRDLKTLQGRVADLLLSTTNDTEKPALNAIQTNITSLLADLGPSMLAGERTAAFYRQKGIVEYWNRLISGLTEDSFVVTTDVPCGITLNQSRQIAVRLSQADRLPTLDGQAMPAAELKDPFVTVSCPSPFVVSAGVEFRFLKSSTFGLVPSGTSGANQFGVTDQQSKVPLPIGMVHVRLAQEAGHRIGLYGSFGVAAHTQGSSSGGSAAEFLTGLSVGFFRTMFVSAGWHFGKVSALSGGYKIGDPVPSGVTTAPVTSSYESGFGMAVTFTKP